MVNKKAIGPVVATSLLIVVAVVAIVTFQTWFSTYSSGLYTGVESTSSNTDTQVERVIGNTLYFDNNKDNLTIDKVEVNGQDCGIQGSYNNSIHSFNISSCLNSTNSGKASEVVVYTKEDIIEYTFLQDSQAESLSSSLDCSTIPYGDWIEVPGNPILGTSNFCVMKYEAKATTLSEPNLFDSGNMYCGDGTDGAGNNCPIDGSVNVTSKAESIPLTQVYQSEARGLCTNLGSGYSLLTDPQWVTIARNAENVESNWADNTIGSTVASGGGLKRGNVGIDDNASYNAASDPADRSLDTNSKAMFTLSNGEEIWDISGNVWEWTNDTFNSNVESSLGQASSSWYEWTEISGHDYLEPFNTSLNADYGMGRVYTDVNDAYPSGTIHGFLRGGNWLDGANAGVFGLGLYSAPSYSFTSFGFRCSYTS